MARPAPAHRERPPGRAPGHRAQRLRQALRRPGGHPRRPPADTAPAADPAPGPVEGTPTGRRPHGPPGPLHTPTPRRPGRACRPDRHWPRSSNPHLPVDRERAPRLAAGQQRLQPPAESRVAPVDDRTPGQVGKAAREPRQRPAGDQHRTDDPNRPVEPPDALRPPPGLHPAPGPAPARDPPKADCRPTPRARPGRSPSNGRPRRRPSSPRDSAATAPRQRRGSLLAALPTVEQRRLRRLPVRPRPRRATRPPGQIRPHRLINRLPRTSCDEERGYVTSRRPVSSRAGRQLMSAAAVRAIVGARRGWRRDRTRRRPAG